METMDDPLAATPPKYPGEPPAPEGPDAQDQHMADGNEAGVANDAGLAAALEAATNAAAEAIFEQIADVSGGNTK